MSQRRWVITWGAFISMGFLGMSRSFLGAALPAIRTTLDMTLIQAGTLCRSAIERACTIGADKVLARQAKRILDIVTCAYTLDQAMSIEERVTTAIEMIANGQR